MPDIRAAFRGMAHRPWFTLALVTTLALGIGINTTVFTLVNAVLFRPLPFPDGERIVTVANVRALAPDDEFNLSYLEFLAMREQAPAFARLEAAAVAPLVLAEPTVPPELLRTVRITPGLFEVVSAVPKLGRPLTDADASPGAPLALVIGHDVWINRYNADPEVIGRAVNIGDAAATIVGVMPDGFRFPNREDIWMPFIPTETERASRGERNLLVVGLLAREATRQTASAEVQATASRLAAEFPATNEGIGARILTFNERFNGGEIRVVFLLMLAAVALLLLIACANVANMMLGRALTRQREMAVRAAIGASRWRLMRQLLVESILLSCTGGAAGLALAVAGTRAFDAAVQNVGKPSWVVFSIDYIVLAYCTAICVGSGLLFGLAPAMRSSRVPLNHVLKDGGRSGSGHRSRLSASLVVVQFALAVVLMAGAGLLIRSFLVSRQVNSFVPADRILTAQLALSGARYEDRGVRTRFLDDLHTRLSLLPGVRRAALAQQAPGQGGNVQRLELDGTPADEPASRPQVRSLAVSAGYFDAIDLAVLRGRDFDERDGTDGLEAAIVTRAFVDRHWPGRDPVGLRLRFNQDQTPGPWLTVVGVTDDLVQGGQTAVADPLVFVPARQTAPAGMLIVVRADADPSGLSGPIRTAVQALDPALPLADVQTLDQVQARARWPYRVFGTAFALFAATALLMAGVGLYATMAQATLRRTREIGIRVALGATPYRVLQLVMSRGVAQLGVGLALGLTLAFVATSAMQILLFGITPTDPIVMALTTTTLLSVGVTACAIPAWRAATLAPVRALNAEDR